MSYVKVFSGSLVEVEHIKQLLQEKGIEPVIKDNNHSASMAGFGAVMPNFQELFVHSDEQAVVLGFLKTL
ncbi:hypothetical protein FHR24_000837 [Wenyingzhuangia heitensis]|uniref:DUF2007 domain-containing protein n=1 Tax=Wenyingzhuangia heitensis TaxID=1487859 RepID=A0ABX0U6C4_9FLAO|nr:DUF2007 domain-containing protein [Wenyingzhuangia heitensis]NIJ44398.1 hypothetical protein [Wenyingzhuangia heitensis]